jgi:hypothetical protein
MEPRRITAVLLAAALLASLLGFVGAAPSGAAPYCGITWGSAAEAGPGMTPAPIHEGRVGRHACFDRFVVQVRGGGVGYDVRYVSQVVGDGSGEVVPLRGAADLRVVITAPTYDHTCATTYDPPNPDEAEAVGGFSTFRQVALVSSFEGRTIFGVGVRARLPFRVTVLPGPGGHSRIVIDVAHRW